MKLLHKLIAAGFVVLMVTPRRYLERKFRDSDSETWCVPYGCGLHPFEEEYTL